MKKLKEIIINLQNDPNLVWVIAFFSLLLLAVFAIWVYRKVIRGYRSRRNEYIDSLTPEEREDAKRYYASIGEKPPKDL